MATYYHNGEPFEVIEENGYTFVRIFYHNTAGGYFTASNAEHYGNNGDYLFSRLDLMQELKTSSESKYVFRLYYPQYTSLTNIWKQTNRPQDETEYSGNGSQNATGYEGVYIRDTSNYWGGLVKSNATTSCYIDGSTYHGNWYYSIASYTPWNNGIPGPGGQVVSQVELWLATDMNKFGGIYDGNTITENDKFRKNDCINFEYSGNYRAITLFPGKYLFECWGAQGGGNDPDANTGSRAGKGGYTKGIATIKKRTTVYVYVGQAGKNTVSWSAGGWNGGGGASFPGGNALGTGGGASDIRLIAGLWDNADSLKSRIIVAGAGGGSDDTGSASGSYHAKQSGTYSSPPSNDNDEGGGHGGGLNGGGAITNGYEANYGFGTQTSGGYSNAGASGGFGYGGGTSSSGDYGGGGGGWYGGGSGGSYFQGGGGGSSYVSGYPGCDTTYLSYQKIDNEQVPFTDVVLQQGVRKGNGFVRIVAIEVSFNHVTIVQDSSKYTIEVSDMYPLGGDRLTATLTTKEGYTAKKISIDTLTLYGDTARFNIPITYEEEEILVTGDVYTNPFITVSHDNRVTSYVLSNARPNIYDKFSITDVVMKDKWTFGYYQITETGQIITDLNTKVDVPDTWDGQTIHIIIHHDSALTPYAVIYYLLDLTDDVYYDTGREEYYGQAGAIIDYPVKEFTGYHSSSPTIPIQIQADGNTLVPIYLDLNEYYVTVLYGRTEKTVYKYTEPVTVAFTSFDDYMSEFVEWNYSPPDFEIADKTQAVLHFKMPATNLIFEAIESPFRRNSNIYKNQFPYIPSDMTFILEAFNAAKVYDDDILQENHGFRVGDAVYLDTDGKYKKALAEDSNKVNVEGIVYRQTSKDVFAIQKSGHSTIETEWPYRDSLIMYLSDKIPGKLVHYSEIDNKIYKPCAVWTIQGIVINLASGTIGDEYKPYNETQGIIVDEYTQAELDDTVAGVLGGL